MLLMLGIGLLALSVYFVAEAATAPARERRTSVRRAANYGRFRISARPGREKFRDRALVPLKDSLAEWVLRLNPRTTRDAVGLKLLGAGLGRRITPTGFLASKAAFAALGALFGLIVGRSAAGFIGSVFFGALVGFAGFKTPDIFVALKARSRKERIRAELPDALDLLAVSVEAGLGFDAAIAKLTEHMDGPLAQEFALTLGEMRIGEGRQEALKKMSDRVDAPELSTFTRAIIQADQLGISLGRILRIQAADTRNRRQAAAEERAMKAPIKMLFPTVLFIFPAMFIIILGPAALNLSKLF
jgi:tight adherence protein C